MEGDLNTVLTWAEDLFQGSFSLFLNWDAQGSASLVHTIGLVVTLTQLPLADAQSVSAPDKEATAGFLREITGRGHLCSPEILV